VITDDAEFTVAAKHQRTPVIAELLLRPAGPRLRYQQASMCCSATRTLSSWSAPTRSRTRRAVTA
jgi:hypothetical protein